jgi:hypothetical protein
VSSIGVNTMPDTHPCQAPPHESSQRKAPVHLLGKRRRSNFGIEKRGVMNAGKDPH